jgi:hypothetical protein
MVTSHEDQKNPLNPGCQRRDGVQQKAFGRVVQVFDKGEGLWGSESRPVPLTWGIGVFAVGA